MTKMFKKLSLKARLGLLYAVLLIFSVALVGSYSYWNVWQLLIANKVSHIRARAKPVREHWFAEQGLVQQSQTPLDLKLQEALVLAQDLTSRDAVAIVLDRQGKVIANGKRLPEEPIAPHPDARYYRKALAGDNEITYRSEVNGKPVLVLLIPLRPQPGSPHIFGVVQVSTSLSDINRMLFRHGAMLIAVVAIILISGIVVGFWLIGISLKDLKALSATCLKIARGDFAQRAHLKDRKDEIGQLSESFNLMIDHLESSFASQKRFVSNAAHELLTPLTGLSGSLEVLLRGSQDDPVAVARLSRGMYKEVNRLIRLCEQLLGLSQLENTSNLQKRPVVLTDFFNDFKQQAQMLAQTRPLIVHEGPFVSVMADPDLLKQVLFDLLANAIRHSPPQSPITLGWKLQTSWVEIWLSDQGEGMDSETLSHVFEPFFQGKSSAVTGEKGIGLGLTLVKSVIEAHGGSIRIESAPGKGTTVFFTLPLE